MIPALRNPAGRSSVPPPSSSTKQGAVFHVLGSTIRPEGITSLVKHKQAD